MRKRGRSQVKKRESEKIGERERAREREKERERESTFQKPRILVLLLNLVKQVVTIFGFHE